MSATIADRARQFRNALGSFATGVTIITTRSPDGADVGVTANSFNSVSLDPPMILWSLAKTSTSFDAFMVAEHFAVHVLAMDQEGLSGRFAKTNTDKFSGLTVERGRSPSHCFPAAPPASSAARPIGMKAATTSSWSARLTSSTMTATRRWPFMAGVTACSSATSRPRHRRKCRRCC